MYWCEPKQERYTNLTGTFQKYSHPLNLWRIWYTYTNTHHAAGVSATIALPPSLFNEVPANRPLIGVFFNFYENSALLPADGEIMRGNEIIADTAVGSYITGATVGSDVKYRNLDPPVTITLGLLPFTRSVSVSWDL